MDTQKRAIKTSHSCRITCERSESARDGRIAINSKAINSTAVPRNKTKDKQNKTTLCRDRTNYGDECKWRERDRERERDELGRAISCRFNYYLFERRTPGEWGRVILGRFSYYLFERRTPGELGRVILCRFSYYLFERRTPGELGRAISGRFSYYLFERRTPGELEELF